MALETLPRKERDLARLLSRDQHGAMVVGMTIEQRLVNAEQEMAQAAKFDFVIINELFERALFDLKSIVHAQRLKYAAQSRSRATVFSALHII